MDGGLSKLRDAFFRRGWTLSFSPFPEGEGNCPSPVVWACPLGNLIISAPEGAGNRVIVDFPDLIRAEVSCLEKAVRVFPLVPDLLFNSLEHFVLDILFPRLIASSDTLVLHGALVAHGEDALETQVDSAGIAARATYPSLRLNPDALDHLFPETPEGTSLVADYLNKFRLDPGDTSETAEATRLRAVFLLDGCDGTDEITVRPVSAATLCMSLLRQSFALNPVDPMAAHGRLTAASAVTAAVPGFALSYPRDFARLPEVMDRVRSTLDQVEATAKQEMAAPSTLPEHV